MIWLYSYFFGKSEEAKKAEAQQQQEMLKNLALVTLGLGATYLGYRALSKEE
jgi:hypothetical protein